MLLIFCKCGLGQRCLRLRVFVFAYEGDAGALRREFHERQPRSRAEAETDDVAAVTLEEMRDLKLWDEVRTKLLGNPRFYRTIHDLMRGRRGREVPLQPAAALGLRAALVNEVRLMLVATTWQ